MTNNKSCVTQTNNYRKIQMYLFLSLHSLSLNRSAYVQTYMNQQKNPTRCSSATIGWSHWLSDLVLLLLLGHQPSSTLHIHPEQSKYLFEVSRCAMFWFGGGDLVVCLRIWLGAEWIDNGESPHSMCKWILYGLITSEQTKNNMILEKLINVIGVISNN